MGDGVPAMPRPRLHKLTIKNFRCIGSSPVVIELNDIVVLVGPNNVGKSTILRAYELVMLEGSGEAKLRLDEFPNGKITEGALPEIELETVVYEDSKPGAQWIRVEPSTGEMFVRERWTWNAANVAPKRVGFDATKGDWVQDGMPWGPGNIAQANRPKPHRVDAFADPSKQAEQVVELLGAALKEQVEAYKSLDSATGEVTEYQQLVQDIAAAQKRLLEASAPKIAEIEKQLTDHLQLVFPQYQVRFEPKHQEEVTFFQNGARLLVGPQDGHFSSIEFQGSGARRTLLWTALRIVAESADTTKGGKGKGTKGAKVGKPPEDASAPPRPNLLLLDEPEICLHPNAIRHACKVLYDLPKGGRWQVMVTTHSPAFIDISRDNTTIVRVERSSSGVVQTTTVFRPETVKLTDDDRQLLKLMNLYDPYVAEFFFGRKNIIVEGDTEYVAFKHVMNSKPTEFEGLHIIRARGKATIAALVKILNHFGSPYSVLHDSDRPTTSEDKKNPAWTTNDLIRQAIFNDARVSVPRRLVASVPNFDEAFLGCSLTREKPYTALSQLTSNAESAAKVEQLLKALIDHTSPLPTGASAWSTLEDLQAQL